MLFQSRNAIIFTQLVAFEILGVHVSLI